MGKAELAWALGTLLQGTPAHHHHMQCKTTRTRKENKTTQSSVTHVLIALTHSHTHTHTSAQTHLTGLYVNSRHPHMLMGSRTRQTCTRAQTRMLPRHALGRSPDFRIVLEREKTERTS